jgi:hypothetical protein
MYHLHTKTKQPSHGSQPAVIKSAVVLKCAVGVGAVEVCATLVYIYIKRAP